MSVSSVADRKFKNFEAWLQKLTEVLKKNISPAVAPPQVQTHTPAAAVTTSIPTPAKNATNHGEVDQLKKSIAHYKTSLEQVVCVFHSSAF